MVSYLDTFWWFWDLDLMGSQRDLEAMSILGGISENKNFFDIYPTGLGTIPIGKSVGIPLENVPKFRVHNITP